MKFTVAGRHHIGRVGGGKWTREYVSKDGRFFITQSYDFATNNDYQKAGYEWILIDRVKKQKHEGLGTLRSAKKMAERIFLNKP